MRAYSLDLRQRVLADCDRGLTTRAVATKYRVSESWVRLLKQRRRDTGETALQCIVITARNVADSSQL